MQFTATVRTTSDTLQQKTDALLNKWATKSEVAGERVLKDPHNSLERLRGQELPVMSQCAYAHY